MNEKLKELNKLKIRVAPPFLVVSLFLLLVFGLPLAELAGYYTSDSIALILVAIIIFFLVLILLIISSRQDRNFNDLYHESVTRVALEDVFEVCDFLSNAAYIPNSIRSSFVGVFNYRYSSEEYAKGSYKDLEFEQCTVTLSREYRDSTSDKTITYFAGNWMIFYFPEVLSEAVKINSGSATLDELLPDMFLANNDNFKITMDNFQSDNLLLIQAISKEDFVKLISTDFLEILNIATNETEWHIIIGIIRNEVHILFNRNSFWKTMYPSGRITDETVDILRNEFCYAKELIDCFLKNYKNHTIEK